MEIRRRPPNPTVRVENLEYAVPHREAQAKNILEEIVWHKDIEIKNFKKIVSLEDLIKKIEKLFLITLLPLAPHTAAYCWEMVMSGSILDEQFPKIDTRALKEKMQIIAIQVNGKTRDQIEVKPNSDQDTILALAQNKPSISKYLTGKTIKKVIHVPNRLINIVVI